ncbi:hypothetical protein [Xanthomonas euvesicatoria]|uniref:hypothetical protein n=1 Tax=Xanthomonas euvesicatoria TaxID=456327 RepID=UPI00080ED318|nr:hypothetical protein [Xanthomonas euvesicatoria]MCC8799100.1 hypothetical protein [Xanthomonas euvesicatoria pv. euvesicatoria]MCC8807705.1 hypothetical protein [Xanthomonas euvesicatoria pv. euvesicatoria]MCC8816150.1 hypothetical protein [Xanthomonas euvesicatoria pv. euvesicatoria]OCG92909.1 hypothetical protein XEULMG905_00420 [Xanthomonas euvesicatoria]
MEMSPYQAALRFIQHNSGTGAAGSLAKLMLSLWNSQCAFAVSECLGNLDRQNTRIALDAIEKYARDGETEELSKICRQIHETYPRYWELGAAATKAKSDLRARWEIEAGDDEEDEDEG